MTMSFFFPLELWNINQSKCLKVGLEIPIENRDLFMLAMRILVVRLPKSSIYLCLTFDGKTRLVEYVVLIYFID